MFNPRAQSALATQIFDPRELVSNALNTQAPWESIVDFATHPSFCGFPIFPRQATLLKLIFLETEQMTQYDRDVIEEWRRGFALARDTLGVQPDIWHRVEYLKNRGYRRFPHIQMVLGRRASKGALGGLLGAEQVAYLHSLDNPQKHYGIAEAKDVYCNVGGTSQTQAARQLFADVRTMIEQCKYFRPEGKPPWIAESKEAIFRVRTPADLRRIAEMRAARVPIDHQVASLVGVALSANSVAGRGPTSFCLDPETLILTADLRWVPLRAVLPGDEVVGIDEYAGVKGGGIRRGQRKVRHATVLARAKTFKKAYRLTFDDGRSVVCSADHQWLVRRSTGEFRWRPVEGWNMNGKSAVPVRSPLQDIKVGDDVVELVKPWDNDDSWDAGYLSGIFDGEGSLGGKAAGGSGISVHFSQNPGAVLDGVLSSMKDKGFQPQPQNSNSYKAPEEKQCQQWAIRGMAECLRFLGQIRPIRLHAKAALAYDGVSLRGRTSLRYKQPDYYQKITAIEELPEQELIDIQTTTGTFIANGFVSHNCNMFDEFSYHVQTGSVKSDTQIYKDWQPSLGQFGIDALTYIPSSPATKAGQFYVLYEQGKVPMSTYNDETGLGEEARQNLVNTGLDGAEVECEPSWFIFQNTSWGLYTDWEDTNQRLGLGYSFSKPPEPDLTDERQIREKRRDPEKFRVEKEGQFSEVQAQYLNSDKVDKMFEDPGWRAPLTPQAYGVFSKKYRIHCDPGLTGANFSLAIAHLEDAPPDEHGRVWPHVIFDFLKVWRPMDFPEDEETHKRTIDYVQVHSDIEDILSRFMSTERISFDQWNSASFISSLKQKFNPGIRVSETVFSEKENQIRFEKFKSALNLGWVHSMRDNFYLDNVSCLLELELKFLSTKNGKVIKQEVGPVVTKDLADSVMVVTVDLLHHALDRYSGDYLTKGAYGSTDGAGLKSGREFDRMAQGALNPYRKSSEVIGGNRKELGSPQKNLARSLGTSAKRSYEPNRLSSIHSRPQKNTRDRRKGL